MNCWILFYEVLFLAFVVALAEVSTLISLFALLEFYFSD